MASLVPRAGPRARLNSGTAHFVPGVQDAARDRMDAAVLVARTRDGVRTFDLLRNGLPQQHAHALVHRHGLDIDSGGATLAFGSTTGNFRLGDGRGDQWQQVSGRLRPVCCLRCTD